MKKSLFQGLLMASTIGALSWPSPAQNDARLAAPTQHGSPPATLYGTPPPGTTRTTTSYIAVGGSIIDGVTLTRTIDVAGLDPYLWDVDLSTRITHGANGNLDITLTSPVGTVVTITTDNGGAEDNVFLLTEWDDDALETTNDRLYTNNTNSPSLVPEGALAAFVGENPNGTWEIAIFDDAPGEEGVLSRWDLVLTTVTPSPVNAQTQSFTNNTVLPVPDADPVSGTPGPVVTSTINVSMPGTSICDVNLQTFITHRYNADLEFSLRSPLGTEVVVSTNSGEDNDNVFNGTLWDDDALFPVTDAVFQNNVVESPLTVEAAFGAFHGENPNGVWTFKIRDVFSNFAGSLNSWRLEVTTCAAPTLEPFCFGDGSGTSCPCGNNSPLGAMRGCLNGLGLGGKLTGSGNASVSADTLQLLTEDTPVVSYVLYWQSRYTPNMGLGSPFDDGLLCAQAPLVFLGSRFTNRLRRTQFPGATTRLSVLGAIPPEGGTRFLQAWYRNSGNQCGTGSNLTNGLKVLWVP